MVVMNLQFLGSTVTNATDKMAIDTYLTGADLWTEQTGYLFLVADIFGSFVGRQESQAACRSIANAICENYYREYKGDDVLVTLELAFKLIHQNYVDQAENSVGGSVIAAVIKQNRLYFAQIGNCSAYLFRNGRLTLIAKPYLVADKLLSEGAISEQEYVEFRKSPGNLYTIANFLGGRPAIEVQLQEYPVMAGDAILLCSNGFEITEQEIADALRQSSLTEAVHTIQRLNKANLLKKEFTADATVMMISVLE